MLNPSCGDNFQAPLLEARLTQGGQVIRRRDGELNSSPCARGARSSTRKREVRASSDSSFARLDGGPARRGGGGGGGGGGGHGAKRPVRSATLRGCPHREAVPNSTEVSPFARDCEARAPPHPLAPFLDAYSQPYRAHRDMTARKYASTAIPTACGSGALPRRSSARKVRLSMGSPGSRPASAPHPDRLIRGGASDAIMDDMELADASTTRLPAKPDSEPPPSVLLAYLANYIANPNNCSPQGAVIVDPSSLGAISAMMDAEATRLKELNRQMNQMSRMVETFDARLKALEGGHVATLDPKTQPAKQSYAKVTAP
ncbi:hypothetical protein PtB15_4B601 [Puccinia triticina]|nr:hypothetical protein PtB15_4B601 [Puccinia triticina]